MARSGAPMIGRAGLAGASILNDVVRTKILALRNEGISVSSIATRFGVSKKTVYLALEKMAANERRTRDRIDMQSDPTEANGPIDTRPAENAKRKVTRRRHR